MLGDYFIYKILHGETATHCRALFHNRQLLYLAKAALAHCAFGTGRIFGSHLLEAGMILLRASDQFHLRNRSLNDGPDCEARDYAILSEFIAVNEYSRVNPTRNLLRAYQMLAVLPQTAAGKWFFLDLEKVFFEQAGMSLKLYLAMSFALFVGWEETFYSKSGHALTYHPNFWDQADLPRHTIELFWSQLSASAPDFRAELLKGDHGSNDFTIFRQWPLVDLNGVRHTLDWSLILQKLWSGPFWLVFRSSPGAARAITGLTAHIFERYIDDLLGSTCAGPNRFTPSPMKGEGDRTQLIDGMIVCGDDLILVEYKSVMFRADAKYSYDVETLRAEVERKLLQNEKGRPKGVTQLANAIKYLRASDLTKAVQGENLSRVKRVYPLVVTLEPLGDGLVISRILNRSFERICLLNDGGHLTSTRLHCTGIQTLELVVASFGAIPVSSLLDRWDAEDPFLKGAWKAYFDSTEHPMNDAREKAVIDELAAVLTPLLRLRE